MAILATKWNFERSLISAVLIIFFLLSCSPSPTQLPQKWIEFSGRESKTALYRIKIPADWEIKLPSENLQDSRNPLISFSIKQITVTIHNFPGMEIPPKAQVIRWQKQFSPLEKSQIIPQAFSGYSGLLFEGQGRFQWEQQIMLAWALHLGEEHRKQLINPDLLADITIKAVGPVQEILEMKDPLMAIGRSFEMINPIYDHD